MALLFPSLIVREPFVWKAGEAKSGVADADTLTFVAHDLGSNINEGTLSLGHHFPSNFSAVDQDKAVYSLGCVAAVHNSLMSNLWLTMGPQSSRCQLWG